MLKVALIDDYAGIALECADWSQLDGIAEITCFREHLSEEAAAEQLAPFDVICTIRERMAMPRSLFEKLPNLKLLTIIGMTIANIDMQAATDHGVVVVHPDFDRPADPKVANATPELTWGLLIATVRHMAYEERRMRAGLWQDSVGMILDGRTLGLLGLGRIGKRMARYAQAFGMEVIAWSQNLTEEAAAEVGVRRVEKDELFAEADIVSIHVVLSERTRGIVGAHELSLMKPGSYLINTSRGPIVDEAALLDALRNGPMAGAGLDVFFPEPLPVDHPLRSMENVTPCPHLGYTTRETLERFYEDKPAAIAAYASGKPIRVVNPEALEHARQKRA